MGGARAQKTTAEKRADSKRFAEQIEDCIAAHEALLPRPAWGFLSLIARDDDLWTLRSLIAGLSTDAANELLFSIAKASFLSDTASEQRGRRESIRRYYADLLACVDKLEKSYAGAPVGYEPTKVAGLLDGLRYARSDLTQLAGQAEGYFAEYVSTRNSNAASTRHANFTATVSKAMEKALGQPYDVEVAKLATALLGEPVSDDKVRKARRPRRA